jgi:Guanylate-binding protein, N-terminal domain
MSQPFVKIEDKKLQLKAKLDFAKLGDVKVVSILGKARMGKSSFLNCIASYLAKDNKKIFSSMGGGEHITKGIDFYHIPEQNILLLDSQGLAHYDAQHDPILLLFVYLISDVIIFNERMMLQNEALKLLEPVCAFLNFVDVDDIIKPSLFFRISDCDLNPSDAEKNLNKIMAEYPDQYQSIRASITHLFQEPLRIVPTTSLDKAPKAFIDAGTFKPLLSDEENGFKSAIEAILATVTYPSKQKNQNIANLPRIIEQINNNQKIDISKLDVVQLTTYKEIRDWIDQQPKENYAPITVDGTQKSFEENVTPRLNKKKAILTAFSKRFKSVPDSVKDSHYVKLAADLAEPIGMATADCVLKAEERVRFVKVNALANRKFPEINNNSSSFTMTADAGFISQYLRLICNLETACVDIYEPVKQKYVDICKEIYKSFTEILDKVKALEDKNLAEINTFTNEVLKNYVQKSTTKILALSATCLLQKDDDIVRQMFTETISRHTKKVEEMYTLYNIAGDLHLNSAATFYYSTNGTVYIAAARYDHTKECCTRFTDALKKLNNSLADVVVNHKKSLLFGKYLPKQMHNLMLVNHTINFGSNSFIKSTMLDDKDSYITEETFTKMYLPVLNKASECLKEKGYISEAIDFTNPTFKNTRYFDNLRLILEARIIKIYCMEVTKGTKFAEELNLSEVLDKISDLVYNSELDCFINMKGECFAADLDEETLEPIPDMDQKIGIIDANINPENATMKDFAEFVVPQ